MTPSSSDPDPVRDVDVQDEKSDSDPPIDSDVIDRAILEMRDEEGDEEKGPEGDLDTAEERDVDEAGVAEDEEEEEEEVEPAPEASAPSGDRTFRSNGRLHDDLIRLYFHEMGRVPLLTAAEEVEISRTIAEGHVALRESIFRSWTSIERAFELGQKVVDGEIRPESFLSEDFVE